MSGSDVAQILRAYRVALHRSARQVSLAAGLSESVVGKVEATMMEPSLRVFAAIVTELGLSDREIALLVRLASAPAGPDQDSSTISTT